VSEQHLLKNTRNEGFSLQIAASSIHPIEAREPMIKSAMIALLSLARIKEDLNTINPHCCKISQASRVESDKIVDYLRLRCFPEIRMSRVANAFGELISSERPTFAMDSQESHGPNMVSIVGSRR
jgi:hypothetical protein